MIEINKRKGQPRLVRFLCSKCNNEFYKSVPFGCFVEMDNRAYVSIMRERPGQMDILVDDIWCNKCGCSGGLTKVSEPKTEL